MTREIEQLTDDERAALEGRDELVFVPHEPIAKALRIIDQLTRKLSESREACAAICESMVVGGRALTHDQHVAAEALLTAAKNIRGKAVTK